MHNLDVMVHCSKLVSLTNTAGTVSRSVKPTFWGLLFMKATAWRGMVVLYTRYAFVVVVLGVVRVLAFVGVVGAGRGDDFCVVIGKTRLAGRYA